MCNLANTHTHTNHISNVLQHGCREKHFESSFSSLLLLEQTKRLEIFVCIPTEPRVIVIRFIENKLKNFSLGRVIPFFSVFSHSLLLVCISFCLIVYFFPLFLNITMLLCNRSSRQTASTYSHTINSIPFISHIPI